MFKFIVKCILVLFIVGFNITFSSVGGLAETSNPSLSTSQKEEQLFLNLNDEPQKTTHVNSDSSVNFSSMLFSLFIVIVIILALYWAYSKYSKLNPNFLFSNSKDDNLNSINILKTRLLEQGRTLYIVEVNNKKLLLGSTPSSISVLTELDITEDNT